MSQSGRSPDHTGTPKSSGLLARIAGKANRNRSRFPEEDATDFPEEDATVAKLLQERLERLPEPKDEDVHKAFGKVEFERRLRDYRRAASLWRAAQVGSWLAIASLGLLGSVLAAVESGHIIAVVAGSLVAILTTFAQAAHPGRQADGYQNARRAIRDEAWDLLNGTGDYEKETDEAQAFKMFAGRIRKIVTDKRSVTQLHLP
jgi:hypothetical protein